MKTLSLPRRALAAAAARTPLEPFFRPRSVAVVGATEAPGSVGRAPLGNLLKGRGREIFRVSPKRPKVLGRKAYAGLKELPARPGPPSGRRTSRSWAVSTRRCPTGACDCGTWGS